MLSPEAFVSAYHKGLDFGARKSMRLPEWQIDFRHYVESATHSYRQGVVRAKQKRYAEAEVESALQAAPCMVDAGYNLGLVYDLVGRRADALRVLSIYGQLRPNSPT